MAATHSCVGGGLEPEHDDDSPGEARAWGGGPKLRRFKGTNWPRTTAWRPSTEATSTVRSEQAARPQVGREPAGEDPTIEEEEEKPKTKRPKRRRKTLEDLAWNRKRRRGGRFSSPHKTKQREDLGFFFVERETREKREERVQLPGVIEHN